jgi:hypothetical protein
VAANTSPEAIGAQAARYFTTNHITDQATADKINAIVTETYKSDEFNALPRREQVATLNSKLSGLGLMNDQERVISANIAQTQEALTTTNKYAPDDDRGTPGINHEWNQRMYREYYDATHNGGHYSDVVVARYNDQVKDLPEGSRPPGFSTLSDHLNQFVHSVDEAKKAMIENGDVPVISKAEFARRDAARQDMAERINGDLEKQGIGSDDQAVLKALHDNYPDTLNKIAKDLSQHDIKHQDGKDKVEAPQVPLPKKPVENKKRPQNNGVM